MKMKPKDLEDEMERKTERSPQIHDKNTHKYVEANQNPRPHRCTEGNQGTKEKATRKAATENNTGQARNATPTFRKGIGQAECNTNSHKKGPGGRMPHPQERKSVTDRKPRGEHQNNTA